MAALSMDSAWNAARGSQPRSALQKSRAASVAALRRPAAVGRRRYAAVAAQANELNKWADMGNNYDEHGDTLSEWATYDKDTATVVLRLLTSKATQRLLLQLNELDLHKAAWLNNYCSAHPPSEGNKFLSELMRQPSSVVTEQMTGMEHKIEPANLAHRIIQIRADMAHTMAKFPRYMELENAEVMRQHLMASTFVSGSSEKGYKERRGYNRPRSSPPRPGR